jgi:outer membrane protein OmpA-like peptidoglycan-associated protein
VKRRLPSLTIIAVLVLTACATTPERIQEIEQARARVESLAQNPGTTGSANKDLSAARAALSRAEQALEAGEDREIVVHLAYLADRRAELGLVRIEEAEARERIAKAEAERNRVRLEAREREARAAQEEAQVSRQAAVQARAELETMQREFAALQARQTARGMVLTLGDVLFDTDQATLKPGAAVTIDRLADFLSRNEEMRIRVEGHTDSTGSDAYNSQLSQQRAQAVADALAAQNVSSTRVEVQGRGEGFPVASNASSAGRQQNRRVEILFSNQTGTFTQVPETPPAGPQPPGS